MSKKKIIGITAAAIVAVVIIAAGAIFFLRATPSEARETALVQTGGGEIVSESTSTTLSSKMEIPGMKSRSAALET